MIIFGTRSSTLGTIAIKGTPCSHCGDNGSKRITVFGKYFHVFWIPTFPFGKSSVMECTHCLKTIAQRDYTTEQRIQYQNAKGSIKTPIWHWAGLLLIAALIAFSIIAGTFASASTTTKETDPRAQLLTADMNKLATHPTLQSDSISYAIKQMIDNKIVSEMKPEEFKYFSHIQDNKLILLIKIRKLKKVDKEYRPEFIEMIEEYFDSKPSLDTIETYIGLHGKYNMMVIKNPTALYNSRFVSDRHLYDFYGDKSLYGTTEKESIPSDTIKAIE